MSKTTKASEVISTAKKIASKRGNSNYTPLHIERALIDCQSEVFRPYIDVRDALERLDKMLDKLPAAPAYVLKSFERAATPFPVFASPEIEDFLADASEASISIDTDLVGLFAACFYDSLGVLHEIPLKREVMESIIEALADEEGYRRKTKEDEEMPFGGMTSPFESQKIDWHEFVTDLVESVKDYDKPFIGREDVIESTVRTLARRDKCNPLHVGEPGVGKTAVTLGLAKKIATGDVPDILKKASLFSVDLAGMLAGTCFRGDFEKRLKAVLDGVLEENEMPILFIDEIHMIIGAGATGEGTMDASNILKPFLTEGKIRFIGATTFAEYQKYFERDKALERRFQKIDIEEPSIEDAIKILDGVKVAYENHHHVTYTKDAVEAAVNLSAKYINNRYLPDKAIDLIDESGATHSIHPELGSKIDAKDIEAVIASICKIPKITNGEDELKAVRTLGEDLKKKVFGQDDAINSVVEAIKISKSGLTDGEKPIGSFLFVGPSGVGKTEIAKQLSNIFEIPLIRFDMSEYQESHTVSKLIGSPAGYIGYEEGGLLTESIRRNPHCVLLFDEIEKAHPDIFKTFLGMMDYGMLTDNKGRKINCKNCIIIMTSNAGATVATKPKTLGFGLLNKEESHHNVNVEGIMEAVEETFSPEFRNRLTGIAVFNGINDEIGKLIVKKELKTLAGLLKAKGINATFTEACVDELVRVGVSPVFGARGIQRTIDDKIKKLFVNAIINGTVSKRSQVDFDGTNFVINAYKPKPRKPKTPALT